MRLKAGSNKLPSRSCRKDSQRSGSSTAAMKSRCIELCTECLGHCAERAYDGR